MQRSVLAVLLLALIGCSTAPKFEILKRSAFTYPTDSPITLFIDEERDRSGGQYRKQIQKYELKTFKQRISRGLQPREIKVRTYTGTGEPMSETFVNPFVVVQNPAQADMTLTIHVDGFAYGEVEVTRDRISFWNGFGITTYVGYEVVPRVLVAISCTVFDTRLGKEVYRFEARGVSVNRPLMREGYRLAMDRCVGRFYERFLEQ